MENTMARDQGARAQMALAFKTSNGTPPVGGFTKMPFASTSLGADQPLLNSELLGYGRDPLAPIKDAVTADGDVVEPLDAEAIGLLLKAAFGDVWLIFLKVTDRCFPMFDSAGHSQTGHKRTHLTESNHQSTIEIEHFGGSLAWKTVNDHVHSELFSERQH
jgi:hypothetical protein